MTTPRTVTDEQVAAYRGMVEAHAARFTRLPLMQADFDDFVQEGLTAVWNQLAAGRYPANIIVVNRMRDWARIRLRQLQGQSPMVDLLDESTLAA